MKRCYHFPPPPQFSQPLKQKNKKQKQQQQQNKKRNSQRTIQPLGKSAKQSTRPTNQPSKAARQPTGHLFEPDHLRSVEQILRLNTVIEFMSVPRCEMTHCELDPTIIRFHTNDRERRFRNRSFLTETSFVLIRLFLFHAGRKQKK